MIKCTEFKEWLDKNTNYTKQTKSNIISRLKRADKIIEISNEPVYIFILSQSKEFGELSVNVRSQLRRSVKLYLQFIESEAETKI